MMSASMYQEDGIDNNRKHILNFGNFTIPSFVQTVQQLRDQIAFLRLP